MRRLFVKLFFALGKNNKMNSLQAVSATKNNNSLRTELPVSVQRSTVHVALNDSAVHCIFGRTHCAETVC